MLPAITPSLTRRTVLVGVSVPRHLENVLEHLLQSEAEAAYVHLKTSLAPFSLVEQCVLCSV